MIKAVIFDLDGVLVTTDELHFAAWKALAEELGITGFTKADNARQRGVSRMASLEVVLRAENSLAVYADWMKYNSRSIYGCTMAESEFIPPVGTRLTQSEDGSRLYIHLIEYPATRCLTMRGLAGKIDYAQFLHDGSEILYRDGSDDFTRVGMDNTDDVVVFNMPVLVVDIIDPVIEVFLK